MNDEAIQKIISYANEYLFEPRSNWSKQAIMEGLMIFSSNSFLIPF